MPMPPPLDPAKRALLDAILPDVAFDGWSPAAFNAAVAATGMDPAEARALCPGGAADLAVAFHEEGDRAMLTALDQTDLSALRFRDRVALALKLRIEAIDDKEAVRRAASLFALPHMAPRGARLVWGTADRIWTALGDTSTDANWYTKRATLSGVWGATVLFWLGDDSTGHQATGDFIARRIDDVMRVESAKAKLRDNPMMRPLNGAMSHLMSLVKAPARRPPADMPGHWSPPEGGTP